MRKKIIQALVFTSSFILAACSDDPTKDYPTKAKVEDSTQLLQYIVLEFPTLERSSEILYFDVDASEDAHRLVTGVDEFTSRLEKNDLKDLSDTLYNIASTDAVVEKLAEYESVIGSARKKWAEEIKNRKTDYETKITSAEERYSEAKKQLDGYEKITAGSNTKINKFSASIKEIKTKIEVNKDKQHELIAIVKKAMNEDILSHELTVNVLGEWQGLYGWEQSSGSGVTRCKDKLKYVTVNRIKDMQSCFYLELPYKELKGLPSNMVYSDHFQKYYELHSDTEKKEDEIQNLYSQIGEEKKRLRKSSIVASNKYGRYENLKYVYNESKKTLDNLKNQYKYAVSTEGEADFLADLAEKEKRFLKKAFEKYLIAASKALFDKRTGISNASLADSFELNKGSDLIVAKFIVRHPRNGKGNNINNTVQIGQVIDLTQDFGENKYIPINLTEESDYIYSTYDEDFSEKVIRKMASLWKDTGAE